MKTGGDTKESLTNNFPSLQYYNPIINSLYSTVLQYLLLLFIAALFQTLNLYSSARIIGRRWKLNLVMNGAQEMHSKQFNFCIALTYCYIPKHQYGTGCLEQPWQQQQEVMAQLKGRRERREITQFSEGGIRIFYYSLQKEKQE